MTTGGGSGGVEVARFYALLGMDASGLQRGAQQAQQSFGGMLLAGVGLGTGLAVVTTGIRLVQGAITGSIGAAMSWETAFSQVRRVVALSGPEFGQLSANIRNMAMQLPVTRDALAGIAKVAGQLGIEGVANITAFTETVAKVSAVTGMEAAETAQSLGGLSTIMQRNILDSDKLASAVFGVANATRASERDVFEFADRIAGAAQIVGITDAYVLALSATLKHVGVDAEAGGTAIQMAWLKINDAVIEGGDKLDLLARVSGVSSAAFAQQWGTDADGAFTAFVAGLGQSGDATSAILKALDLDNVRSARALFGLSQNVDLLGSTLKTARTDIQSVDKVNAAFGITAETSAAKVQVFKNKIRELAGNIGNELTAALITSIPLLEKFIDTLNQSTQGEGGVGGGWMRIIGKILTFQDFIPDLEALGEQYPSASGGPIVRDAAADRRFGGRLPAPVIGSYGLPGLAFGPPQATKTGDDGGMTDEQKRLLDFANGIGDKGGGDKADPLKQAREAIMDTLTGELVDAYIKGGDAQVATVREAQAKMMAEVETAAAYLSRKYGIEFPAALTASFGAISAREAEAAAERLRIATEYSEAVRGVQQHLQQAQIDAWISGGQTQLDIVKATQEGAGERIRTLQEEIMHLFGVSAPEALGIATKALDAMAAAARAAEVDTVKSLGALFANSKTVNGMSTAEYIAGQARANGAAAGGGSKGLGVDNNGNITWNGGAPTINYGTQNIVVPSAAPADASPGVGAGVTG